MDEEIKLAEAALLYGCSHTNMSYLVATGRLPSVRRGKLIFLKRADVIALREARDKREHTNERIQGVGNG